MSIPAVNFALTAAGQLLQAQIDLGEGSVPLNITRITTGAGTSDNPVELTEVADEKKQFSITDRQAIPGRAIISAYMDNAGITEGYSLYQIGFYALDLDGNEILYKITQFPKPGYVPSISESRAWSFEPEFNFVVGNVCEVTVNVDAAGTATIGRVRKLIEEHDKSETAHAELFKSIKDEIQNGSGANLCISPDEPGAEFPVNGLWIDESGGDDIEIGDGSGGAIVGNIIVSDSPPENLGDDIWADTSEE